MLLVRFFERPNWTYQQSDWQNNSIFPSSGIPFLDIANATWISIIFCCIMSISIYLEFQYEKSHKRKRFLKIFAIVTGAKLIEIIGRLIIVASGSDKSNLFSLSPFEVFGILLVERHYTGKIDYTLRTIPAFFGLMVMFALTIVWFTTLAMILFDDDSAEHKAYYRTFGGGLWNMLVIINGSNWPTPMIPAYEVS